MNELRSNGEWRDASTSPPFTPKQIDIAVLACNAGDKYPEIAFVSKDQDGIHWSWERAGDPDYWMPMPLVPSAYGSAQKEDTATLLRRVGKLIDQTDPWCPQKCVSAITTVEARKGRTAFYKLWQRLVGGERNEGDAR